MMTQQLDVCVLSAPLAAIDRRALSQAWYSALHCAADRQRSEQSPARRPRAAAVHAVSQPQEIARAASPAARTHGAAHGKASMPHLRLAAEPDRRALRSPLARRIERKFLSGGQHTPRRASFSSSGKRVHVVVQASADRLHLVAVCHPAIREAVTRALAQARFALASRGVKCS